jgi:hypothetical protein
LGQVLDSPSKVPPHRTIDTLQIDEPNVESSFGCLTNEEMAPVIVAMKEIRRMQLTSEIRE